MTDRQAETWERLDTVAVTPHTILRSGSAAGSGAAASAGGRSRLRLRRSRSPVLAALDGGGTILQRRMRDVLIGSSLILVPAVVLNLWMTVVAFDRFDPADSFFPSLSSNTTGTAVEDVAVFLAVVFVSLVTAVVGFFAAQILIGERFLDPVSLRRALLTTITQLPAIVFAWLLTHWWVPLFTLVVVSTRDDNAGGFVFMFGVIGWFASAFTLFVVPAMVGERIGPFAAAKRSWRLARLRLGPCLRFVVLATFLASAFLVGVATLAPLLEAAGFVTFGGAAWIVQGILVQLGVLLTVPLVALGTAQMYVEVRLDAEGLDLVIDADAAFGVRR